MPIQNTMRVLNDMSDSKMLSVMSKMSHKVLVQVIHKHCYDACAAGSCALYTCIIYYDVCVCTKKLCKCHQCIRWHMCMQVKWDAYS